MSQYLAESDYAAFGISPQTWQVVQASNIIDGHLDRPEGLVYEGGIMTNSGAPIVERRKSGLRQPFVVSRNPIAAISAMRWFDGSLWHTADITGIDFFDTEVFLPVGVPAKVPVEITYVAGYLSSAIPMAIKQACANMVYAMINAPEVIGNITSFKSGDTQVTWEGTTMLDEDTVKLLSPWRRSYA